jgi:multidrug efflux pump subunit AcrA (membrane-fusion protein)
MSRVRLVEATLSQSKATLSLAEANFQNTIIRAPFAGVVVKKMAEVGESVAPIPPGVNLSTSSGAIVSMADMATLEAEVDVSESNIAKLQRNQPAQVAVDAIPDHTYRAVLRQVIPTADRTKATIMVKVRLLEKDENLGPEMSAKITFLKRAEQSSRAQTDHCGPERYSGYKKWNHRRFRGGRPEKSSSRATARNRKRSHYLVGPMVKISSVFLGGFECGSQ